MAQNSGLFVPPIGMVQNSGMFVPPMGMAQNYGMCVPIPGQNRRMVTDVAEGVSFDIWLTPFSAPCSLLYVRISKQRFVLELITKYNLKMPCAIRFRTVK